MLRGIFLLCCYLLFFSKVIGQPWILEDTNSNNFFELTAAFDKYWENKEVERGHGYKQFRRWEWFWQNRVKEDGSFYPAGINLENFEAYKRQNRKSKRNIQANWQSEGPNFTIGGYAGIGRINALAFDPINTNNIYAGAAAGGLWKSTDGGNSWITTTDGLG